MRIMLTNDDGIEAPGLLALLSVLERRGDVTVIAPADGQSATSHSLSFSRPLLVSEQEIPGHGTHLAVAGRPADCTRLGLRSLYPTRTGVELPDLVVSGMNAGANAGDRSNAGANAGANARTGRERSRPSWRRRHRHHS